MTVVAARPGAAEGFALADLEALLGFPLSAEQRAAVTAPLEPYVVVAGAGSGKTTVMAARVVWLVATGAVRPEQVLGLTFTTKAAGELAARVRKALARLADGSPLDTDGEPTVSTYHAFAGRLLTEHGLRLGVEPGSRLLTAGATHQLAHRVVTRTGLDLSGYGVGVQQVVEQLLALDGELAEHCIEPADLRGFDTALLADLAALPKVTAMTKEVAAAAQRRIQLAHLVEELRAAKTAREVHDFSDQMRLAARLAQDHPEVGAAMREAFRVVLLDEYQDTSVAQRLLLTGLFGGGHPVTAVGDPLQAIYGWRGASVANIDAFPQHFARDAARPARVLPLAENRRSGARILDAANTLAEPLRELHPQVAALVPAGAKGAGAVRVALLGTYAEEMGWVADRVVEVIAGGTAPSDIAVLCRATADFPAVKNALADRGVAVEVVGLNGMLTAPEVVEVLSVMQVLADAGANAAMLRLLAGPRWRIGPRDLALLGRRAAELAGGRGRLPDGAALSERLDEAVAGVDAAEVTSLLDAVEDPGDAAYDPQARDRFAALAAELRALRRHVGDPLPDLVHRIVTSTGLDVELAASPEILTLHRAEGLAAFLDIVAEFADPDGEQGLPAFLSWLATTVRYGAVPELDRPATHGAVQLLTVHRAKGLEWPVVVLPALVASVFPSTRGLPRWVKRQERLPYPLRGDRASLPVMGEWSNKGLGAFAADCRAHEELEERRLGYVAVTRAESLVLASGSWWGPTQRKPRGPSPYLETLRQHCLDGGGVVDVWEPAPEPGATNPVLGQRVSAAWPLVPEAGALARRLDAADAVRRHVRERPTIASLRAEHEAQLWSPLADLDPPELAEVEGWDADIALLLAELAAARSTTRRVPLPGALSASDLVRLAADEQAFARALARPMPAAPVLSARRGTRFHAWVEVHFGLRPLLAPEDLPGAADADLESDEDLAALQRAFLAGDYAARTPVGVEVPFTLVLAGRVVPGRIDAVFERDGGGFEVVDWKTSKRQSADPLQLAIYRVAYAELAGVPLEQVGAAFVYVRDGAVVRPSDLPDKQALEALLAPPAAAGSPRVSAAERRADRRSTPHGR